MIHLDSSDEIVAYLSKLEVGNRVVETDGCMKGRAGTVYLSKDGGGKCVMWDKLEGESCQSGTSVTGGTRLVSDVLQHARETFETNYMMALKGSLENVPVEFHKELLGSFEGIVERVTEDRSSFLIYPHKMLEGQEIEDAIEKINREIDEEFTAITERLDAAFNYNAICSQIGKYKHPHEPVIGGENDDGYILCRRCGEIIEWDSELEFFLCREV